LPNEWLWQFIWRECVIAAARVSVKLIDVAFLRKGRHLSVTILPDALTIQLLVSKVPVTPADIRPLVSDTSSASMRARRNAPARKTDGGG
jgi:hypothetical protein